MIPLIPLAAIGISGIAGAKLSPDRSGKKSAAQKTPAQLLAEKKALNHKLIQNKIYEFLGNFVKGDVNELWRLIDSFYRTSGGDEKSNLDDPANAWILNGTKVKLFEWARTILPTNEWPPYTEWNQYDYKGLLQILKAWQSNGHDLNVGDDLKASYSAIALGAKIGAVAGGGILSIPAAVVGGIIGGVVGAGVFVADWFGWTD